MRKHAINPTLEGPKLAGLGMEITTFDTPVIDDLSPDSLDIVVVSNFMGPLPSKQELFEVFTERYPSSIEYSRDEALSINGFKISECTPWFLPFTISSRTSKFSKLFISYLEVSSVWRLFSKRTFIGRVKL